MYRVEIRKRDAAHTTLPDADLSDSFFRIAESVEELEDLRHFFGNRIIAIQLLKED